MADDPHLRPAELAGITPKSKPSTSHPPAPPLSKTRPRVPVPSKTPHPPVPSPSVAQTPAEILRQIEVGSAKVNSLATALSDRITAFEGWLNRLPGKVETHHWITAPDSPPDRDIEFGLKLHRSGKEWIISFGYFDPTFDEMTSSWTPIKDGSLAIKMLAISEFPKLLNAIIKSQENITKKLMIVHAEFDAFAKQIGMTEQEGK